MGRTVPSFRTALEMEKEDWKPFRNALDKHFDFQHNPKKS
jgi:hypothetical protein